jgi:hypothetical protein
VRGGIGDVLSCHTARFDWQIGAAAGRDYPWDDEAAAIASMLALNAAASRVLRDFPVHACTDVTGFSLLGHGFEMAHGSGVRLVLADRCTEPAARVPTASSLETTYALAAVRAEDQAQTGASSVRARLVAFIDVFPAGASVVGLAGNQT